MIKLSLSKEQLSDLLNLYYGVFHPLKHFVNEKQFKNILLKKRIGNKFFPIPIYFGVNKIKYNKIKNKKYCNLYYKKKILASIEIKKFFKIDHKLFGIKIFGINFRKHPYFQKFVKENFIFIDFNFIKLNKSNLNDKSFISPENLSKKINRYFDKPKSLAGFHTRNVPHAAHQWAHALMLEKYKNILIQPLIGQYKNGEYRDSIIIKTNQIAVKMLKKNKAFFATYFSYPRYAGPLEAALHAIVRKNYGCTHFWVGRDHAGFKNFFRKYSSQKFCKKNEKKLGIKIIAQNEPYYCKQCKKIVNKKCLIKTCKKSTTKKISGTLIRSLIRQNKNIPKFLMHKEISKFLNYKSIIKK